MGNNTERYNHLKTLREQVESAADKAGRKCSEFFDYSELAVENSNLMLYTTRKLAGDEKIQLKDTVRKALPSVVSDPEGVPICVRQPHPFHYTRYFIRSSAREHFPKTLLDVSITESELEGIRCVLAELRKRYSEDHYLATFALGGLPYLHLLIDEITEHDPPSPMALRTRLDENQRRLHLFAGLNWSGGDEEKRIFKDWLRTLESGSTVTVFDTGKRGHGVRQAYKLAKIVLNDGGLAEDVHVEVLGVVSGSDSAQKEEELSGPGSRFVRVKYVRLPSNPAEDVEALIGYSALQKNDSMGALFAPGRITIRTDSGEIMGSVAAASSFDLLRTALKVPTSSWFSAGTVNASYDADNAEPFPDSVASMVDRYLQRLQHHRWIK